MTAFLVVLGLAALALLVGALAGAAFMIWAVNTAYVH